MSNAAGNPRDAAQGWARALLTRSNWVILDTETTGLDGRAEVVQIGVIAPDGAILLDTLVRPEGSIPPEATAIHGITDAMVAQAPTFVEILPRLQTILGEQIVVSYNAAFDERMLRQTALRNSARGPSLRWECAMEQYARYVGQRSGRYGTFTWQKLPRKAEHSDRRHQAIDDCLATLDVIRTMATGSAAPGSSQPWRRRG